MISSLTDSHVVVLTYKDKGREKNCFQRNDQREEIERKRIDVFDAGCNVYQDPPAKPNNVNPDESHAAAEVGNSFSHDIRMRSLPLGRFLEIADHLHISLRKLFY